AREALRIAGEQLRQYFDGDLAIERRIPGAIHLAHPAGAERRLDHVRTQPGAGSEAHGWMAEIISVRTRNIMMVDDSATTPRRPAPLQVAGERSRLRCLSRHGMGRPRVRRPRPLREAGARRVPGRAV